MCLKPKHAKVQISDNIKISDIYCKLDYYSNVERGFSKSFEAEEWVGGLMDRIMNEWLEI